MGVREDDGHDVESARWVPDGVEDAPGLVARVDEQRRAVARRVHEPGVRCERADDDAVQHHVVARRCAGHHVPAATGAAVRTMSASASGSWLVITG